MAQPRKSGDEEQAHTAPCHLHLTWWQGVSRSKTKRLTNLLFTARPLPDEVRRSVAERDDITTDDSSQDQPDRDLQQRGSLICEAIDSIDQRGQKHVLNGGQVRNKQENMGRGPNVINRGTNGTGRRPPRDKRAEGTRGGLVPGF